MLQCYIGSKFWFKVVRIMQKTECPHVSHGSHETPKHIPKLTQNFQLIVCLYGGERKKPHTHTQKYTPSAAENGVVSKMKN